MKHLFIETILERGDDEIPVEAEVVVTYDHGTAGSLSCEAGWCIDWMRVKHRDTGADVALTVADRVLIADLAMEAVS